MTTARDIMTPGAECADEDASVQSAAERMTALGVGALPICGKDDRLKGMLTDRDIVVKVLGQGKDPARTRNGSLAQQEIVTINADEDAQEIMRTMAEHKVRRLPVLENKRLVGIVSSGDVAQALPDAKVGDLLQTLTSG
jgi:CBS domain-containing protein